GELLAVEGVGIQGRSQPPRPVQALAEPVGDHRLEHEHLTRQRRRVHGQSSFSLGANESSSANDRLILATCSYTFGPTSSGCPLSRYSWIELFSRLSPRKMFLA